MGVLASSPLIRLEIVVGGAPRLTLEVAPDGTLKAREALHREESHALPRALFRRLKGELEDTDITRWGAHIGVGEHLARLSIRGATAAVRFDAEDPRDSTSWRAPAAAQLAIVLISILDAARVSFDGFDEGWPEVMDREGLVLRARPTTGPLTLAYEDGRLERWEPLRELAWRGEPRERGRVDPALVHHALVSARTLEAALRASSAAPVEMGIAHDPTSALTCEIVNEPLASARTFVWGRASQRDAYLPPVPSDVPETLFGQLLDALMPIVRAPLASKVTRALRPVAPRRIRVASEPMEMPSRAPTRSRAEAEALLARVLASPPATLSDLETAMGPLDPRDGAGRLRMDARSDWAATWTGHFTRLAVEAPPEGRLERWELHFVGAMRDDLRRRLEAQAPAVPYRDEGGHEGERFGHFVLYRHADALGWLAQVPVATSPSDPRLAWLGELARSLRQGPSPTEQLFRSAPAGIQHLGDLRARLAPPIEVGRIAAIFDIVDPHVRSDDARTHRLVVERDGAFTSPSIEPWVLHLWLDEGHHNRDVSSGAQKRARDGYVYELRRSHERRVIQLAIEGASIIVSDD